MRVAAIDCGTNSVRLLVADTDPDGRGLVEVTRRMQVVRLGEGVDRTARLSRAALDRTFVAVEEYARAIDELGAERVRFIATSATRDAQNRDDFVDGVQRRIGVVPEVVSGHDEAALSFRGATAGLVDGEPPYLVVDIGGGSTEFVLGTEQPTWSCSVDMGCVRLTERFLNDDPPSTAQRAAATRYVEQLIDEAAAAVPLTAPGTLIGLAGSVTTVAALALELERYDAERIHGTRITAADVSRVSARLLAMPRDERAALAVMHPGRVDVIGGGALVLDRIVARAGAAQVLVSEHDILDGIAWSLAP